MSKISKKQISSMLDSQKFGNFKSLVLNPSKPNSIRNANLPNKDKEAIEIKLTTKTFPIALNTNKEEDAEKNKQPSFKEGNFSINPGKDLKQNISLLSGKELLLVEYLISLCDPNNSFETNPILSSDLISYLAITANHLRNLILRLSKKNVISVKTQLGSKSSRTFIFDQKTYDLIRERKRKKKSLEAKKITKNKKT